VAYKNATRRLRPNTKTAKDACDAQSGTGKDVCIETAKVARANSEAQAAMQYRNDKKTMQKAQTEVADANTIWPGPLRSHDGSGQVGLSGYGQVGPCGGGQ
jgi:hypothetical protein